MWGPLAAAYGADRLRKMVGGMLPRSQRDPADHRKGSLPALLPSAAATTINNNPADECSTTLLECCGAWRRLRRWRWTSAEQLFVPWGCAAIRRVRFYVGERLARHDGFRGRVRRCRALAEQIVIGAAAIALGDFLEWTLEKFWKTQTFSMKFFSHIKGLLSDIIIFRTEIIDSTKFEECSLDLVESWCGNE